MQVRIEEKKDDHADGHEIHVDEENDAGVVETPAALEAAGGVGDAEDGEDHGEDEQRRGVVVGEVGEQYGDGERPKDKQASANEGMTAEMEEISADKVVVGRFMERRSRASGRVEHTSSIGSCVARALFGGRSRSSGRGKRRQLAD